MSTQVQEMDTETLERIANPIPAKAAAAEIARRKEVEKQAEEDRTAEREAATQRVAEAYAKYDAFRAGLADQVVKFCETIEAIHEAQLALKEARQPLAKLNAEDPVPIPTSNTWAMRERKLLERLHNAAGLIGRIT